METQTIGLFEAKTHLSELVAQAEQGREIIITRHNKPVAKLVPIGVEQPFDVERRRKAVAELQRIGRQVAKRTGKALTVEEIAGWVREGRDERSERLFDSLPTRGRK